MCCRAIWAKVSAAYPECLTFLRLCAVLFIEAIGGLFHLFFSDRVGGVYTVF